MQESHTTSSGKQVAFERIVRVLLLKGPDHDQIWCRRGRSGSLRLLCKKFPVRQKYPADTFQTCMDFIKEKVEEVMGRSDVILKPQGWLGRSRKVVEPSNVSGIPTRYKVLTLVVFVDFPHSSSSEGEILKQRSKPQTGLHRAYTKAFRPAQQATGFSWIPFSWWVKEVWNSEVLEGQYIWNIIDRCPSEARFREFLHKHRLIIEDEQDLMTSRSWVKKLYQELSDGLCTIYQASSKVEKYWSECVDGGNHTIGGSDLLREQHTVRIKLWRGSAGSDSSEASRKMLLVETGPEDLSDLVCKVPGLRFKPLDPGGEEWNIPVEERAKDDSLGVFPYDAIKELLRRRLNLPVEAIRVDEFRAPFGEMHFSRRYPGLLTNYIVHEVWCTMIDVPMSWSKPCPFAEATEIVRRAAAPELQEFGPIIKLDKTEDEAAALDAQPKGPVSSLPQSNQSSMESNHLQPETWAPNQGTNDKTTKSWALVKKLVNHHEDAVLYAWMTPEELQHYNITDTRDATIMNNRFALAQAIAEGHPEGFHAHKNWLRTIFIEGAANGHMAIIQKCLGLMSRGGYEADDIDTVVQKAIEQAAQQYRHDTVRLLIHFKLERIRRFLENRHIRNLSLAERAKLEKGKLQQLLFLAAFAGDDVSVRRLLRLGIELGVPMNDVELLSPNVAVNRAIVELSTDLSFLGDKGPECPGQRTLRSFLEQLVRVEMHKVDWRLSVIDFVANCELPLHQCCACATELLNLEKKSTSQRDRIACNDFAEMFMTIMVRTLDDCTSLAQSRQLLQQEDGSPANVVSTTVAELAVFGKLTKVIEHHSFQALAQEELYGTEWARRAWTRADNVFPGCWGYFWRILLTIALCTYMAFLPLVYLLNYCVPAVADLHNAIMPMLESSYFKLISSMLTYTCFVAILVIRSSSIQDGLFESLQDTKFLVQGKGNDILLLAWSTALVAQVCYSPSWKMSWKRPSWGLFRKRKWDESSFVSPDNKLELLRFVLCTTALILRLIYDEDEEMLDLSEQLLGLAAMFSVFKFFTIFKLSAKLGPLYFCMRKMLADVLLFAMVLIISGLGFWIAFAFCVRGLSRRHEEIAKLDTLGVVIWTLFGELSLGDDYTVLDENSDGESRGSHFLVKALLFLCIFVHSVVLVNLLIAMMNNTITRWMVEADAQQNTEVFFFLRQYKHYSVVPPPMNLVVIALEIPRRLLSFLWAAASQLLRKCRGEGSHASADRSRSPSPVDNGGHAEKDGHGGQALHQLVEQSIINKRRSSLGADSPAEIGKRNSHVAGGRRASNTNGVSQFNMPPKGTEDSDLNEFRVFLLLSEQSKIRGFVRGVCAAIRESDASFERQRQAKSYRILEHRLGFSEVCDTSGQQTSVPEWLLKEPEEQTKWASVEAVENAFKTYLTPAQVESFPADAAKKIFDEICNLQCRLDVFTESMPAFDSDDSLDAKASTKESKRLIRTVQKLQLIVSNHSRADSYLIEIYEFRSSGQIRVLNRLPEIQIKFSSFTSDAKLPLEDAELQHHAEKCIAQKLSLAEYAESQEVTLQHMVYHSRHPQISYKSSTIYPGLLVRYVTFTIECVVAGLPDYDFVTVERESGEEHAIHHWKWKTESEVSETLQAESASVSEEPGGHSSAKLHRNKTVVRSGGVTSQKLDEVLKVARTGQGLAGRVDALEKMVLTTHEEVQRVLRAITGEAGSDEHCAATAEDTSGPENPSSKIGYPPT